MKLLRIRLHNILGAPDGLWSFADARTGAALDVALIAGAPASGKTSLLEAIAAAKEATGAYGTTPFGKRLLRRYATSGRIEATWLLSDDEQSRASLRTAEHTVVWNVDERAARVDVDPRLRRLFAAWSRDHGNVEYFPSNRTLDVNLGGATSEAGQTRLRLTRDVTKYAGLGPAVRAAALEAARDLRTAITEQGIATRAKHGDPLAPFADAVAVMLPDLRLSDVDLEDPRGGLRFIDRDRRALDLADLSDSERQGVLFALAFRCFGLSRSLVLIDEPELHIHAADRARFLHALIGLGKDNQIIAATGSAEITTAASPGQLVVLPTRARREVSR